MSQPAAMSPPTVDDYQEVIRKSGLVTPVQLQSVLNELEQECGGKPSDTEVLAQRLEQTKIITAWQNAKLLKGCSKGFFLGRYKLLAHLGSGGMSSVYLAEHTFMKRRVAVKVLHHKLTENPSILERFYRESRVTAAMDHPNIVRAFDVDCENNHHYLVIEYIEGMTLRQIVEKQGPLDFRTAADYIRQAADGLQYAHKANLVHRDVKPCNLLITPKGVVKVLDLGMALNNEIADSLTVKNNESMLGTADYLSPEQALDSHNVDARTDIYSLGCTLYYSLTGHPPFGDGSMALRLMRHQTEAPPSIRLDRSDAPDELMKIADRMMAKSPNDRFQTARAVSEALAAWIQDLSSQDQVEFTDSERSEDDDTFAGVNPYTIIETVPVAKIEVHPTQPNKVRIFCPACQKALRTTLTPTTVRAHCPHCNTLMTVPGADSMPTPVPAPKAPEAVAPRATGPRTAPAAAKPAVSAPPPKPAASLAVKPAAVTPAASAAKVAPQTQGSQTPGSKVSAERTSEINRWNFETFVTALEKGDLRLVEAVGSLLSRSGDSERVAEVLSRLLSAASTLEKKHGRQGAFVDERLLRAIISALGSIEGRQATLSLGRIALGYTWLGCHDRMATEAALQALSGKLTPDREDFLVEALLNADEACPIERVGYTAAELRASVASIFLKHASPRVRQALCTRMATRNINRDTQTLVVQILRQ